LGGLAAVGVGLYPRLAAQPIVAAFGGLVDFAARAVIGDFLFQLAQGIVVIISLNAGGGGRAVAWRAGSSIGGYRSSGWRRGG